MNLSKSTTGYYEVLSMRLLSTTDSCLEGGRKITLGRQKTDGGGFWGSEGGELGSFGAFGSSAIVTESRSLTVAASWGLGSFGAIGLSIGGSPPFVSPCSRGEEEDGFPLSRE